MLGVEVEAIARVTEAQRIEQGNEEAALELFKRGLPLLPDPRRRQGVRYPLVSVITVALMAMVWGEANAAWLNDLLDLPHGVTPQNVFLAVFGALDPEAFSTVFRAWIALLRVRARALGRHLAVDGKTSRRSFDNARDRPAIHTVSACLSEEGVVLGQKQTADKSNEITAIPELLRTIDLRGTTVTIDAMGCQTEIAKTIVDGGGQYLLAVKENQPALHQDLVTTFAEAAHDRQRTVDECARPVVEIFEESDKGHGRVEKRSIALCRNLDWMMTPERWAGLSFVTQVTRERTVIATGKTSTETAYYIGSDAHLDARGAAVWIRRHWSIENELHWVLDMAFREDEARPVSATVGAYNLAEQRETKSVASTHLLARCAWNSFRHTRLGVEVCSSGSFYTRKLAFSLPSPCC